MTGSWSQSYVYDGAGRVRDLTYPNCTGSLNGYPSFPRTVSTTYTYGRPTAISGFAGPILYHQSRMMLQVQHANGMTVLQGADPAEMPGRRNRLRCRPEHTMQLWGKAVSTSPLLFAAVFLTVAIAVREARAAALACAAISIAVALFGVPRLVRAFSSFAGDEELLASGPGSRVAVRVDPRNRIRVAIDWREPSHPPNPPRT